MSLSPPVHLSPDNGETADKAVDGTVSKGVEFELNGAIT